VLTGTLVLQERLKCITHQLLNLPNGLHFREIVWKTCVLEELERVTELVERCSDTLECIDVSCQMSSESDIRCLYPRKLQPAHIQHLTRISVCTRSFANNFD
jgi:hypothetical protein